MEKELPGSPPPNEPIKPKAPETNSLKFEFHELNFDSAFSIEEDKYFRFFINRGANSFFLEILRDEYFYFFDTFADLYEEAENNDACTCSECIITEYEEVDEVNVVINATIAETNEDIKIDENYKVYLVYSMENVVNMSIHESHVITEPTKD